MVSLSAMTAGLHGEYLAALYWRTRTPDLVDWWAGVVLVVLASNPNMDRDDIRTLFIRTFTPSFGRVACMTTEVL